MLVNFLHFVLIIESYSIFVGLAFPNLSINKMMINGFHIFRFSPEVLRLKLVIFDADCDGLDAVDDVSEDAADAVLVVVQRVRRRVVLDRRSQALQAGIRLPGLKKYLNYYTGWVISMLEKIFTDFLESSHSLKVILA